MCVFETIRIAINFLIIPRYIPILYFLHRITIYGYASVKFHMYKWQNPRGRYTLKLHIYHGFSHPRDFDTRRTTIYGRAFARKNSGDGIAKRNIPVDFTSAISLRELNKNISPRSRRARRAAKWNVCTSFCPSHSVRLSPLLFPIGTHARA